VLYINDLACSGVLILFYFVLISPSGETLNKILVLNSTFDIANVKLELENIKIKTRTLEQSFDTLMTRARQKELASFAGRDLIARLTYSWHTRAQHNWFQKQRAKKNPQSRSPAG
jgi:hypothetical protein